MSSTARLDPQVVLLYNMMAKHIIANQYGHQWDVKFIQFLPKLRIYHQSLLCRNTNKLSRIHFDILCALSNCVSRVGLKLLGSMGARLSVFDWAMFRYIDEHDEPTIWPPEFKSSSTCSSIVQYHRRKLWLELIPILGVLDTASVVGRNPQSTWAQFLRKYQRFLISSRHQQWGRFPGFNTVAAIGHRELLSRSSWSRSTFWYGTPFSEMWGFPAHWPGDHKIDMEFCSYLGMSYC